MDAPPHMTGRRTPGWWLRFYAWRLAGGMRGYDELLAPRKRALLGGLSGTVVEIGPGAGPNLAYYAADIHWIGVEPNPYMRPYLVEAAARRGMAIEIVPGVAERIDLPDASADAVVCTLVLCSVADAASALREIRRVLRPGGRFVFIEHVAAPAGSRRRSIQRLITPCWSWLADGCHMDRETWRAIEQAGFATVQIEHFQMPIEPAAPHIAGTAVNPW